MSNCIRTLASLPISFAALCACGSRKAQPAAEQAFDAEPKNLYFGDLHNHNSIGQSWGSLERTFEIAPTHVDFFTFTLQSQWPDMREIPEGRNTQFERVFQAVHDNWAKIRQLTAKVNKPGEFAAFSGFISRPMADTFSGYEVHHNDGDFNIIHPGENGELVHLKTIEEWQEHVPRSEMDPGTARTQWKKALRTQQERAPSSGRRSRLRFLTGVVQFHQESIGSCGGRSAWRVSSSAAKSHSTMCSKPVRQSGQRRSTACRCSLVKMAAAAPGVSELCSSWRQRASSVERWRFARKPS